MRIAVDLDGTLTLGGHSILSYLKMKPDFSAIDKINNLSEAGEEIFIYTARPHMEHEHICEWLDRHGVHFDHLECGKLKADMYVDNNSRRISDL